MLIFFWWGLILLQNFVYNLKLMADLRLTSNANTNNQPLYTSVNRQGSQDYVYSSTTGNQPPINRLGSQEYTYTNAGISGNINAPLPNTGIQPRVTAVGDPTANVTTVPYGVTSAYSSGYKSGGYASGYNPNPNQKTNVNFTSNSNYAPAPEYQQIKTQVVNTGPGYNVKQQYKEVRGPSGGTYERKYQQTRPAAGYAGYASVQPAPNIATTNSTYVPVANRTTYSQQPAPVAVASRQTGPPPVSEHHEEEKNKCPLPLLALLGLLAVAGIVLGLLFGLGVIGGKNGQVVNVADQPVNINGVDYSRSTITQETTVVNSTAGASASASTSGTSGTSGTTSSTSVSGSTQPTTTVTPTSTSTSSSTSTQPTSSSSSTTTRTSTTNTSTTSSTTPTTSPTRTTTTTTTTSTVPTTSVSTTSTVPTTSVTPSFSASSAETVTFNPVTA